MNNLVIHATVGLIILTKSYGDFQLKFNDVVHMQFNEVVVSDEEHSKTFYRSGFLHCPFIQIAPGQKYVCVQEEDSISIVKTSSFFEDSKKKRTVSFEFSRADKIIVNDLKLKYKWLSEHELVFHFPVNHKIKLRQYTALYCLDSGLVVTNLNSNLKNNKFLGQLKVFDSEKEKTNIIYLDSSALNEILFSKVNFGDVNWLQRFVIFDENEFSEYMLSPKKRKNNGLSILELTRQIQNSN